jgi:ubiquinone biosynthesis O-methyltransferase
LHYAHPPTHPLTSPYHHQKPQPKSVSGKSHSASASSVGPLRSMNPVRSQFIRRWADAHFGRASALRGARVLDVGCGGGLLSETLAQLGCDVVGLDASAASVSAAREHYDRMHNSSGNGENGHGNSDGGDGRRSDAGSIEYVHSTVEEMIASGGEAQFDVVCALEVIEHVPRDHQHRFVFDCRALVKPGGCMFVSTMNRTARALALAVFGAEVVMRMVPPGTHDWGKFVTPEELERFVETDPWSVDLANHDQTPDGSSPTPPLWSLCKVSGMQYNPLTGTWHENELDTEVNYIAYMSSREQQL